MNVEWLPSALNDLQELRNFLGSNPDAAREAAFLIRRAASSLKTHPYLGKAVEDLPGFYDIIIPFRRGSYILRYKIHHETVFIVVLRHSKEAGFSNE
jgi:addiction module RelE/StbE family toxin